MQTLHICIHVPNIISYRTDVDLKQTSYRGYSHLMPGSNELEVFFFTNIDFQHLPE